MTSTASISRWFALLLSLFASGCGGPEPEPRRRLLIVGWDGATFDLVDPLVKDGRLPHLGALMERGTTAELASTIVPISSAAWVGAVTGTTPGNNGVYDFFEPVPGTYNVRLTSSQSNAKAPLWRILGWHDLESIVFGVPLTWPPEEIDGVLVAGMLSPFDAEFAHPPGLAGQLRQRGFEPDLGIWRENQQLTPRRMDRQLELKRDILVELLAERDWDMTMVVFKSLDVLGHRVYGDHTAMGQWYERLDAVLGDLLDAAGDGVDVIVLSDHGFHAYPSQFFTHAWLLEQGFAAPAEGARTGASNTGPLATARAEEHALRLGELDLSRTRAFAGAAEGNFGGIRINLVGREPGGIVTEHEVAPLIDELGARLRAARIPGTDRPLVTNIVRASDLYPGRFADRMPDLLFETDPDVAVRPVPNGRSFLGTGNRTFPDHARTGLWIAAGPSFAASTERRSADIFDLAPTALHVLGLPVHTEMEGAVRTEMLTGERPVREVNRAQVAAGRGPKWRQVEGDEGEVLERLMGLGYTEAIDSGGDSDDGSE